MELQLQTNIIGSLAGILIIISLIPQLVQIIYTKSAKDISISTYMLLFIAQILWVVYGILKNDLQIYITNLLAAILTTLIILFAKFIV